MSLLELKQEVCRLSKRERGALFAYLVRLKHETPEWKRATAQRIRAVKTGRGVSAAQLEARMARG
jgi:hypothetical protein